ncbi:MAG: GTPase ObgE [Planctomycetota bacterium]
MFIDEAHISVQAGKGGDGAVHFRREKYLPKGGPDGGRGGHGGSVILQADENLDSLLPQRRAQRYAAQDGRPGRERNRTGASGGDLLILLPVGTVVRERANGRVLADLTVHGQVALVARGGRGGRGNRTYATPTHQAPREFEYGEPGEALELDLEIKLIADVGLVGLPNAGKSTILARLSEAHPRIADYPFTTLDPQLGLVEARDGRTLVLADIPGLIEDAHRGAGLGHEFLRHVERTQCLAHVIDLAPADGSDPAENVRVVERELARFSADLAARPALLVGNKIDLPGAEKAARRLAKRLDRPVVRVSGLTGRGESALRKSLFDLLKTGENRSAAPPEPDAPAAPPPLGVSSASEPFRSNP